MRMLMKTSFPVEAGNKGLSEGVFPKVISTFVEQFHPEACYFVAENGRRTGFFFVDVKDPTVIPSMAEPFFLRLNASIELTPAMNLEEMKTGVDRALRAK